MKQQINVFDVANYIILKSKSNSNNNLTHMKLHKIIYYAYVSYLIKNKKYQNKRLILESPQAWKYGPVFGTLFHVLHNYYEKIITKPLIGENIAKIDIERFQIIDDILAKTNHMDGLELTAISHCQTPWDFTFYYYLVVAKNNVISDKLLLEFFLKNDLFTKIDNLEAMFYKEFPDCQVNRNESY
ncbi:MAG: Panacea domain-containing protein [Candidatus Phytoplasma pyri]